ncbi:MAG: hypothetical protein PHW69_06210 [Elusimicrobiaceae bacterium]|nr:hypothetical protein [Elusimicrobiaceae bacterium]
MTEFIGYLASVLIAISLMMSNIWRLRWLNLLGAAALTVYGIVLRAWPVAAVNLFIVFVDAYYLWALKSRKDFFSMLNVPADDKVFLAKFLEIYGEDIEKFFPGFSLAELAAPTCVFILRNLTPVGLFIYDDEGDGTARIRLDYAIAAYRDLSNARFLFHTGYRDFIRSGIREFVFRNPSPLHCGYMRRMGFTPSVSDPAVYVMPLAAGRDFSAHGK